MALVGSQTWSAYLCYLNSGGPRNSTLTKGVRVVELEKGIQYHSGSGTEQELYVLLEKNEKSPFKYGTSGDGTSGDQWG